MHLLRLVRWKNLALLLLIQVFVYLFLADRPGMPWQDRPLGFLLVCASTLLLAAAGYVINDYADIKIDVINKPEKLIVGRLMDRRSVLLLHTALNVAAVLLAVLVGRQFALLCLGVSVVLWLYSVQLKSLFFVGNLVVALLMGLSLLVVRYATPYILEIWVLFYAFFAFLTGLIREVIKDIEDMEGDRANGCRTIPIVLGIFKTKLILYYLSLLSLSLLVLSLVYLVYQGYIVLAVYLAFTTTLPLVLFFIRLISADSKADFSRLSRWIKLIMLAGVVSMALRFFQIH